MKQPKLPSHREVQVFIGLIAGILFCLSAFSGPSKSVFSAFYSAGSILRQGNASKLYEVQEQARVERAELDVTKQTNFLVYVYPPAYTLLFVPLALLPYPTAYLIWGAMNVLLWVSFQHLLRPYASVPRQPLRYLLLCSAFLPLWVVLVRGQTTLLLLVTYSLVFVSLKRNQDIKAGVFLGLGLLKFQLVLPFALICLLRGKWKLIAGFASAGSVLGALSALVVGPRGVLAYGRLLINLVKDPSNQSWGNFNVVWNMPTLKGLFGTLLTGRVASHWIDALVGIISAFLIMFTVWKWRREDQRSGGGSLNLMFAAALVVTLVTGTHLYVYDLTLMILAVLLVIGSPQWQVKSRWRLALTVAIAILYAAPLYVLLGPRHALYLLMPVLVAFAGVAIGLASRSAFVPGQAEAEPNAGVALGIEQSHASPSAAGVEAGG